MRKDGYHDQDDACNVEYDYEIDDFGVWSVYATDYDYDGEELGVREVASGICVTMEDAKREAEEALARAKESKP